MAETQRSASVTDAATFFNLRARRYFSSQAFDALYGEGMQLISDTVSYLDSLSGQALVSLDRLQMFFVQEECGRLSNRTMVAAFWLLRERSVGRGEMDQSEMLDPRHAFNANFLGPELGPEALSSLPEGLQALIQRSYQLFREISKMEAAFSSFGQKAG